MLAPKSSGLANDFLEVRLDRSQALEAERSDRPAVHARRHGPEWQLKGRLHYARHPSSHYLETRFWHLQYKIWEADLELSRTAAKILTAPNATGF